MLCQTPNIHFLVQGSSEGFSQLNSFDGALLAAGIGNTNLVKMSSIVPPRSLQVEPVQLPYGSLVPVAYAAISSMLPGEKISAAVAAAFPEDESKPGLIMEYSSRGHREEVETIVRKMAEEGLAMRGEQVQKIASVSVQHTVEHIGTAFAAVVLWYR
ncbi:MAG: arginine decarboxylase, pyruvoyl-dependent [Deltaproteobacteria bacterium]|nr:arginine decarboxylase, pyruvoyl-dependent [Candidatus Anaeroferrophillus wilburensis]MBN2890113.1 arginine decarboxylase, pyruvoyl-dependent [Deltaproteobacteria bacterium]